MFRIFPMFLVAATTLLTSGSIGFGADPVTSRGVHDDFAGEKPAEVPSRMRGVKASREEAARTRYHQKLEEAKARKLYAQLYPEYQSLLSTVSPETAKAVDNQLKGFNDLVDNNQISKTALLQKTIGLLKANYVRRNTYNALTSAINATPDQAFSNENNLISGIEKNIQAPSSKWEFDPVSGKLKFKSPLVDQKIGGGEVKTEEVNVYDILNTSFKIAKKSAVPAVIVACAEIEPITEACKKLIDDARNQLKMIFADSSIKKEIEDHTGGPGGVANKSPRPDTDNAFLQTHLTAIESLLQ
jgi:hypothetical protein